MASMVPTTPPRKGSQQTLPSTPTHASGVPMGIPSTPRAAFSQAPSGAMGIPSTPRDALQGRMVIPSTPRDAFQSSPAPFTPTAPVGIPGRGRTQGAAWQWECDEESREVPMTSQSVVPFGGTPTHILAPTNQLYGVATPAGFGGAVTPGMSGMMTPTAVRGMMTPASAAPSTPSGVGFATPFRRSSQVVRAQPQSMLQRKEVKERPIFSDGSTTSLRHAPRRVSGTMRPAPMTPAYTPPSWTLPAAGEPARPAPEEPVLGFGSWSKRAADAGTLTVKAETVSVQ